MLYVNVGAEELNELLVSSQEPAEGTLTVQCKPFALVTGAKPLHNTEAAALATRKRCVQNAGQSHTSAVVFYNKSEAFPHGFTAN